MEKEEGRAQLSKIVHKDFAVISDPEASNVNQPFPRLPPFVICTLNMVMSTKLKH